MFLLVQEKIFEGIVEVLYQRVDGLCVKVFFYLCTVVKDGHFANYLL